MKTFVQVFLVAVVCFALGLVTTKYFQASLAEEMRASLAKEIKALAPKTSGSQATAFPSLDADRKMEPALQDRSVFEDRKSVARREEIIKRGPHGEELIAALRNGGFTIFFRHTARDQVNKEVLLAFDLLSLTQAQLQHPTYTKGLCLNAEGKAQAWLIGNVFRELNIPIGKVMASPICRAREMAEIAFGRVDELSLALVYRNMVRGKEENEALTQNLRNVLEEIPAPGTNKVMTSHSNVLQHLPEGRIALDEGDAAVFRHGENGRLIYASRMSIQDWPWFLERVDLSQPTQTVQKSASSQQR